jgi:MGT family glycosyltransferase
MLKGLYFCLPSFSFSNLSTPVIDALAGAGYEIIYYNLPDFAPAGEHFFTFKEYPRYLNGYHPGCMGVDTSYFQFAEILIDTSTALMDFLLAEVEREKPDFILHSHLAIWGKLVADHYKLPAISLITVLVLDGRIMQNFLRDRNTNTGSNLDHVASGRSFYRKTKTLYDRLGLHHMPDIWDAYVNREKLNIAFHPEQFQPQRERLGPGFKFAGFLLPPVQKASPPEYIYVSMGTILNDDPNFYSMCIRALIKFPYPCILSVGNKIDIEALGALPARIKVLRFVDQPAILKKAKLFITRGGMASVQEAIHAVVPMIVIPVIAEQQLMAQQIAGSGMGIALPAGGLTEEAIVDAIRQILDDDGRYRGNITALVAEAPAEAAEILAYHWIDNFLKDEIRSPVPADLARQSR